MDRRTRAGPQQRSELPRAARHRRACPDHEDEERMAMLTVVVAGGGFAGVETTGAVNDVLHEDIQFCPHLREGMLRILLVHHGEVVLPELSESLGRYTRTRLKRRGVGIRLKTGVVWQ